MGKFDCIERPLSRLFYRYGRFVALHPLPFIVIPLLTTAACAIGFLHLHPITDAVYLFTPTNAPSKRERLIVHNLWPLHDHNYIAGRTVTQSREIQVNHILINLLNKNIYCKIFIEPNFIGTKVYIRLGLEIKKQNLAGNSAG